MQVAITGASGLIGSALSSALRAADHEVVEVTRRAAGPGQIGWDPAAGSIDANGFAGLDAVVHLAGEGIAEKRWTDEQKRRIRDSREQGTALLADALAGLQHPPRVLLSGSAVGWYGDRGDEVLTEESARGTGFLSDVCEAWETATAPAGEAGIRVTHLRTGIVLSANGGALAKQLPLFKIGLGGRIGSGQQYWPWISMDDEVGAISWLLSNDVAGPVNLTGPEPVTNREFTAALGAVLGRPTVLPVPRVGPRFLLGRELADNLLYTSARVVPHVMQDRGYVFQHTDVEAALRGVLGRPASKG